MSEQKSAELSHLRICFLIHQTNTSFEHIFNTLPYYTSLILTFVFSILYWCASINSMTLWSSQLWILTLFQLSLTSLLPPPFITIQRIHAVHKGCAEDSQRRLIARLVGAELERREGNRRIVAVGATSRDMGTEWGSGSHYFCVGGCEPPY